MSEKRVNWTDIQLSILYNQVDGICPMCQKSLYYVKDNKINKLFEIAHIYPLNPSKNEIEILENEPKLFEKSRNDLNNVIALCPNCHTYIDKPTTVNSYRKLYDLKIKFINQDKILSFYSSYTIEDDIIEIINSMSSRLNEPIERINYKLIKVDDKIDKKNGILINKVKYDVSQYYLLIKKLFAEIELSNENSFNIIAGQIKSFYLKIETISSNQNDLYDKIAEWLYSKYQVGTIEAYKIIVSFFIQNCEVFSDVAK